MTQVTYWCERRTALSTSLLFVILAKEHCSQLIIAVELYHNPNTDLQVIRVSHLLEPNMFLVSESRKSRRSRQQYQIRILRQWSGQWKTSGWSKSTFPKCSCFGSRPVRIRYCQSLGAVRILSLDCHLCFPLVVLDYFWRKETFARSCSFWHYSLRSKYQFEKWRREADIPHSSL